MVAEAADDWQLPPSVSAHASGESRACLAIERGVVLWPCEHLLCFSCRHSRHYFRESNLSIDAQVLRTWGESLSKKSLSKFVHSFVLGSRVDFVVFVLYT